MIRLRVRVRLQRRHRIVQQPQRFGPQRRTGRSRSSTSSNVSCTTGGAARVTWIVVMSVAVPPLPSSTVTVIGTGPDLLRRGPHRLRARSVSANVPAGAVHRIRQRVAIRILRRRRHRRGLADLRPCTGCTPRGPSAAGSAATGGGAGGGRRRRRRRRHIHPHPRVETDPHLPVHEVAERVVVVARRRRSRCCRREVPAEAAADEEPLGAETSARPWRA